MGARPWFETRPSDAPHHEGGVCWSPATDSLGSLCQLHSTLMFAARMIGHRFSISARWWRPCSSLGFRHPSRQRCAIDPPLSGIDVISGETKERPSGSSGRSAVIGSPGPATPLVFFLIFTGGPPVTLLPRLEAVWCRPDQGDSRDAVAGHVPQD